MIDMEADFFAHSNGMKFRDNGKQLEKLEKDVKGMENMEIRKSQAEKDKKTNGEKHFFQS